MLLVLALTALSAPGQSCCTGMAAFASDPGFAAEHAAPLPLAWKAKLGETVRFPTSDGKQGSGFFVPAVKGNRKAVLMFHEWWGLNDYIKREAESLHQELGAAVLAVDLYDGKVTDDPKTAGGIMAAMDQRRGNAIVDGALAFVKDVAMAKSVGTIGWCFGGGWSHRAAIAGGKDVKACVIYYGMPSTDPAELARLRAPVLMFWGKQDGFINAKVVGDFEAAMKKAGKPLTTQSFDAPHAFANPSNPKYDKAAAADSHSRALAFFRRYLK